MHFRFSLISILLIGIFLSPKQSTASQEINTPVENNAGEVLCQPSQYQRTPEDCARLGPTAYQARIAKLGIAFPLNPVEGQAPDPTLTYVDIRYGEVVHHNAPVYASLEDAVKKGQVVRRIESAYSFISYTEDAVVDGKRFYMVDSGGWMTANDISRIGTPSLFQGLVFSKTPTRPFGWIYYQIESKRTPGLEKSDYTGHQYYRYQVVPIFSSEVIDGVEWYMIGPDEWIPEKQDYLRLIGRVIPNTTPPEGVDNGRWIEVNLYDQTIAVYDQSELVYASVIASGIEPFWTRPGLFQVYQKFNATMMRGSFEADHSDAYYLEDVPWTLYYDKARALHGAYWHNSFGSPRSHGCVNLSVGDARWIYDWAKEGDWVYVWDPSGTTPTDPALYGDGGA
jgi:hypothetical protein